MKRFFTLIFALLIVAMQVEALQTSVIFNDKVTGEQGTAGTGSEVIATVNEVTLTIDKGYVGTGYATNYIRAFADATMTISASSNISKIVITTANSNSGTDVKYSAAAFTADNYTTDETKTIGMWTGNSTSVSFAATKQVRMISVEVTLSDENGGDGNGGEGEGEGSGGDGNGDGENNGGENVTVTLPVPIPSVGNANLKICAQNVRNYFLDFAASRADCHDEECFKEKTGKMVDVFTGVDADIYAFCELEAKERVLKVLTDSLNNRTSNKPYAYVVDNISDDNTFIRSGFIYRSDRVKTVGNNVAATSQYYYKYTMRMQAFEHLATGQKILVSMNHFKAQDDETDEDEEKRVTNATDLITKLNSYTSTYDYILILGDLNCEVGEEALTIIENAGYTEQLLRFDETAFSHCYGGENLIDHVYANASLAAKVTGAAVYHISTKCGIGSDVNYDYRYSDHDPYLVGLNLPKKSDDGETSCENLEFSETFASSLGQFEPVNVVGTNDWYFYGQYNCAYINGQKSGENDDWLISPSFDLSDKKSATLTFSHAAAFGSSSANWSEHLKVKVSANYNGNVSTATWHTLDGVTFNTSGNYKWKTLSLPIPEAMLGQETVVVAFHYNIASADDAPAWEVKNFSLKASCEAQNENSAVEQITKSGIIVYATNGTIKIENAQNNDVAIYTLLGQKLLSKSAVNTLQTALPQGIYIVHVGNESHKVVVR